MNTDIHIEQLEEWWEDAEDAPAKVGDLIIERHVCEKDGEVYYTVGVHREGMRGLIGKSGTRILSRARKPAWHDAVAIIATGDAGDGDLFTGVWVPEGPHGNWISADTGIILSTDQLYNVTPLIEAKVTDEMVDRVLDVLHAWNDTYPAGLGTKLAAAALGIEEGS